MTDDKLLPLPASTACMGWADPLWNVEKMRSYARTNVAARDAEIARLRERVESLEAALRYVVNQNEHDMVLTGDEIRGARAALADGEASSA